MDENHQDKTESGFIATEGKLWLPPLSPKDQEKLDRPRNHPRKAIFKQTGFADKTLWDWLNLLGVFLIPLMIGVFTAVSSIQQAQMSQQQHDSDQKIALDQQRETTLRTYLDDMSDLLLNHNLSKSKPGDEVSQIARERTIATLRTLDASRNGIILQFLQDAHLISMQNAIIELSNANLSGDDLSFVSLTGVHLTGTNLTGAKLIGTKLTNADLSGDILTDAHLAGAQLIGAKLNFANLARADLTRADLTSADLISAHMVGAHMVGAQLAGADLTSADLTSADLTGAIVTPEQLAKTRFLKGAIMPDGSPLTGAPTPVPTKALIPALHSSYSGVLTNAVTAVQFPMIISSLTEGADGHFSAAGSVGTCPATLLGTVNSNASINFTLTQLEGSCGSSITGEFTGQLYSDGHLAGVWQISSTDQNGTWSVS